MLPYFMQTTNRIPFNKPYLAGRELDYIAEAVASGWTAGNKTFTKKCHQWFEQRYGFPGCLLTTSCTDALEMAALLLDIQPGDEVILPAYTFVSTANAFALRGATLVFADSSPHHPNIDPDQLESLITDRTKAIVLVHYGGVACDMGRILELTNRYSLFLVEDAAQAIDAYWQDKPLGSLGHLSAFSFHETKNVISGEGGMLVINDTGFRKRAEIIWEKGTNRSAFFRGEVDKYNWVDIGSSFLPSELTAAFLYGQLEEIENIQNRRLAIWERYRESLSPLAHTGQAQLPTTPDCGTNNGHLFYLVCRSGTERTALIQFLKSRNIHAVFHYLALHQSPYFRNKHDGRPLPQAERYTDCLLRLPLYVALSKTDQDRVIRSVLEFYRVTQGLTY